MTSPTSASQDQLADQATRCIDANDLRGALAACEQLNRTCPGYAYGWYLASFALKRARRLPEAIQAVEHALALDAADRYVLHKAKCLFEARDRAAALATLSPLLGRHYDDARLHEEIGSLSNMLADYPAALRHFSRAVELEPRNPEFVFNRAALLRYMGDAAGAEAGFDAVIALKPDEYEAYNARSQVRTQTAERNHVPQLRALLERTIVPAGVVQLSYALAKELEDLGEDAASFAALRRGADTKRRHMRYDVARCSARTCSSGRRPVTTATIRSSSSACRAPARRSSSASSAVTPRSARPAS
jgi:tetratricopeptide (TPR) repeat protein